MPFRKYFGDFCRKIKNFCEFGIFNRFLIFFIQCENIFSFNFVFVLFLDEDEDERIFFFNNVAWQIFSHAAQTKLKNPDVGDNAPFFEN